MSAQSPEELVSFKLLILKDLEKSLKLSYVSQYRNVLSKIVTNKKRFMKKNTQTDMSEDIFRYNNLTISLSKYLLNLFDVFGESAVLNAKRIFEENAVKWGRKLGKKLEFESMDINYILMNTYIDLPGIDYIDISGNELIWYLIKSGYTGLNSELIRFHPKYYDIKALWLHTLINSFAPQYTGLFEKKSENEDSIVTGIQIKEGPK